jgi:hypothetical protein
MREFANCIHQLIDGARLAQITAFFVLEHFGNRRHLARNHGLAAGHRFENRQAEAFAARGLKGYVGLV